MDYYPRGPGRSIGDDRLERVLPWLPWLVLAFLLLSLVGGTFYTVEPSEQAVLFRFGRYQGTTSPGLHLKVPLADEAIKVNVAEHSLRLPYGAGENQADTGSAESARRATGTSEEETLMLTGDLNTASVEWTMQWRVTEPRDYVIRLPQSRDDDFAERLISSVARKIMNRLVGDYSFDEVIGAERSDIAASARREIQEDLDAYACGVTITALQMQRVVPPDRVRPSFEQVNRSIQEKQKSENEGESERNKLLPEARAHKDRLIREAEGYAARRRAEANGEIQALRAQTAAYKQAPEVTRRRLYLEAMEEVLVGSGSKTILDSDVRQVLPFLNLDDASNPNTTTPTRAGGRP